MGYWILDANGNEVAVDLMTWAQWFEDHDRRIARTDIAAGAYVSTVFVGIDLGHGIGPPLLYETMVFGGPLDSDCRRASTRAEAQADHQELVALAASEANRKP